MSNDKTYPAIFQSRKTGDCYPTTPDGKQIDTETAVDVDLTQYKKMGGNNLFIYYEPKMSSLEKYKASKTN